MKVHDDNPLFPPLRAAAEARLRTTQLPELSPPPVDELLHELRVHQIELEMQNEALRLAQQALEESRDRFVDLYEFAPVGYLTLTAEGMIVEINLTAVTLLKRGRGKLLHKSLRAFVLSEDQDRWVRHLIYLKKQDEKSSIELKLLRGDGMTFHAQLDCAGKAVDTDAVMIRVAITDITERKHAEAELRIAAIAFSAQNGMIITDAAGVIQRVNPAFTYLTGYTAEEVIGRTPALLQSGQQEPSFYQRMWGTLAEKGYWQGEVWNKRKNGQLYAELLSITAIYTTDLRVEHYVASFTDITQSKAAEAEIHRLAYYDPLTQLPNRRLLQDRLNQAILSTSCNGLYGVLFFIDLDHFKSLNDTRGHDVGDLLLIQVAQRLCDAVPGKNVVARQGGDEFVVLIEELDATVERATEFARRIGSKIHAALMLPFNLNGYEYHCQSSIGGGLFQAKDSVKELFKHADLALYHAKKTGGDKLQFFDPAMQQALEQRSLLENELRQAIAQNQLKIDYQPQVDSTRRVVGVEALLRWQHPTHGLISPDDFIPLAEETGLILPIGHWVMEQACAQIKQWEAEPRTRTLQIAVNVSARQFRQTHFVAQVQDAITRSGIWPDRLKLELTESLAVDDIHDTIAKMHTIKQLGVQFSMDDFGTGYSSLSYLAQLPLDQIKIDKSFVRNLFSVIQDETIVRAIITMGLGLNLNVIAEGVETESQFNFLEAHGCHAYQGYLFSRPLPIEALTPFLLAA